MMPKKTPPSPIMSFAEPRHPGHGPSSNGKNTKPSISGISGTVLTSANRFPYSSTPAVSPTQPHNLKTTTTSRNEPLPHSTENFKKPYLSNSNRSPLRSSKKVLKTGANDSAYSTISPIRAEGNKYSETICLTGLRNENVRDDLNFHNSTGCSTQLTRKSEELDLTVLECLSPKLLPKQVAKSNGVMNRSKVEVPLSLSLLEITAYNNKTDRGAILLNSLRLLKLLRAFELEKEKSQVRKRINSQKGAYDDTKFDFPFTSDMFYTANSQACLHVLHLLFECYDSKEAAINFRDVWPVHEKKMEGLFRRVALKWLKEIVEKFSHYFTGIKVEALGGLLVNSGGDRFMQLIEGFANLVLFLKVGHRGGVDNNTGRATTFEKPTYTKDSGITSRQILTLQRTTQNVTSDTQHVMMNVVKNSHEVQSRLQTLKSRKVNILNERTRLSEIGNVAIEKYSRNGTNSSCSQYYSEKLSPVLGRYADRLTEAIEGVAATLMERTAKANSEFKILGEFHNRFKSFWYILKMDMTKNRVIDGSKLFMLNKPSKPTIRDFIGSVNSVAIELLHNKQLNAPLPDVILHEFKTADMRFGYLKLINQDVESKFRNYGDINIGILEEKLQSVKDKLKDIDWRSISKVDLIPLNISFFSPPTTRLEHGTASGYTPALLNFLNNRASGGRPGRRPITGNRDLSSMNASKSYLSMDSPKYSTQKRRSPFISISSMDTSNGHQSVMSPISRFVSTFSDRPALPKTRLNVSTSPSISFKSYTRQNFNEVDDTKSPEVTKSTLHGLGSRNELDCLDVPLKSDSDTATDFLDTSTQERFARVINLLVRTPRQSLSFNSDIITEMSINESHNGNGKETRNSLKICSRVSTSSVRPNNSDAHDRSLRGNWKDEKEGGIMDVSGFSLYDGNSDSDEET